jgi:signal transduction histidine kinase
MWDLFFYGLSAGLLLSLPAAWVWTRRNAARVRRLEQRTRDSEHLAELGMMTSGLAHEIKNPLSTVGLNTQLIQEDLDDIERQLSDSQGDEAERVGKVRRRLQTLHREVDRLREILEDFLQFAGRFELEKESADLNTVVDQLTDFFEPQATEAGVRLRCDLANQPVSTHADVGLLKQALLNLLINACQAMVQAREKNLPHGGADELLIRTARGRDGKAPTVEIHVTDTGPGMTPQVIKQIFQPYFSTKRGGTGLGLPTTRRIVQEHGGQLHVHSEPGRGSDFTITLPAPDSNTPATTDAETGVQA